MSLQDQGNSRSLRMCGEGGVAGCVGKVQGGEASVSHQRSVKCHASCSGLSVCEQWGAVMGFRNSCDKMTLVCVCVLFCFYF